MKRKYISILVIATLALVSSSCSNFLDVKPVGKLIPSKSEDLADLLNSNNTMDWQFRDGYWGNFYALLGDNYQLSENQSKYFYTPSNSYTERFAAYTFNPPYENPYEGSGNWSLGIYRAVEVFNNVIDGVQNLPGQSDTDLGKVITAQAKAGRAWTILLGALAYGPAYDPTNISQKPVMPYRTFSDPNTPNPALSNIGQLFDLAEQDLKDALVNAPVNVGNPSRANLAAVHGLLAQLYMYKRDWPKMLTHAQEAWDKSVAAKGGVNNLIYNLNDFYYQPNPNASPAPGTDVEVVLDLQGPDMLFMQSEARENLFYRPAPDGDGVIHYPSQEFIDVFDKNTDRRYKLFMLKTLGYSTTVGGVKYDDGVITNYYKDTKVLTSQGLTYPELLLMKAEANARLNNLSAALADLNLLRTYRYSGASTDLPSGGSLGQDALLFEILKERRRELPIATCQRTFDIKRYSLDQGKPWSKTSITHHIGTKAYTAPINEEYFTLQISNPILEFNPQWGIALWNGTYDPTSKK
ncbi:RagB/SusD family nutrient uptake outer membrane protein [Sphingobacterium yanglingense]|uniref:Putative outer membrane starch-binding protein n=1 Tax=Sphingobacterium yanglingense TaxID=1437280 RepID=A0A4R6WDW1_9SPHI|nr:RagB/SusD family nutrient uptake outer membrane protein [Sphingobacterium yanglingense]TDQ77962.1 putative outer membrane starch-binding protein [Sphingobacterium yanglingense]